MCVFGKRGGLSKTTARELNRWPHPDAAGHPESEQTSGPLQGWARHLVAVDGTLVGAAGRSELILGLGGGQ